MASFFRRIAENWKLKSLAFALAILLWVVVSAEEITYRWFSVPLDVQVTDPRYRLLTPETREVEVRFAGPRGDLIDVAFRRPPLRLTIPQVDGESGSYDLNPRMVQLSGQLAVNVMDVRPGSVPLRFVRIDSRLVPIRLRMTDLLGPDWSLIGGISISPEQVRVSGPTGRMAGITEVFTQAFDLTPTDTIIERTVALDTTGLQGLELSARSITVTARLDPVADRVIQNVPIDVGGGVSVAPDRVDVRLRGAQRTVRAISPTSFRVAIAIGEIPTDIPPEGVLVPLRIDRLRPDVLATVEPLRVRLLPVRPPPEAPAAVETPPEPDTVAVPTAETE